MNSITITKTTCPKQGQFQEMLQLASLCRQHDGCSISFPENPEDHAEYFLLYKKNDCGETAVLLSVLSILFYDAETVECCAFTHPKYRRQGYFSKLLNCAMENLEDCDILFPVSGACPDTLAVLDSLDAELDSCEMQMELDLKNSHTIQPVLTQSKSGFLLQRVCPDSQSEWILYEDDSCRKMLGSCKTAPVSKNRVCLHHVEILTEFRNQGYGTILMNELISSLKKQGTCYIILQVSGDNAAALALYKKQGFRTTETLSFYLY